MKIHPVSLVMIVLTSSGSLMAADRPSLPATRQGGTGPRFASAEAIAQTESMLEKGKSASLGEEDCRLLWQAFKNRELNDYWVPAAELLERNQASFDLNELGTDVEIFWLKHPEKLAGITYGQLHCLHRALSTLDLDGVIQRLGIEWLGLNDSWKRAQKSASYCLLLKDILKDTPPESMAAKRVVVDHVFERYLSQASITDPSSLKERFFLIDNIYPYLADKQRKAAEDTLLALSRDSGRFAGLRCEDFRRLRWFMIKQEQEAEFSREYVARWVNLSQEWKKLSTDSLAWISQRLFREITSAGKHFACREASVRLALHQGRDSLAFLAATKGFELAESTPLSEMTTDDIRAIGRMMSMVGLKDRYADRSDWQWLLVLRDVASDQGGSRVDTWNDGLRALGPLQVQSVPEPVLGELDKLLQFLWDDPALPPEKVLRDLLCMSRDGWSTMPALWARLDILTLQRLVSTRSEELRTAIREGLEARAAGQLTEAIPAFSDIFYTQRQDKLLSRAVARCLLPLLLAQQTKNLPLIETCLTAAMTPEREVDGSIWNYACQCALAKAAIAAGDDRGKNWAAGIPGLWETDAWISKSTLSAAYALGNRLTEGASSPTELQVLTDLLCMTSDIRSMCRIQARRVMLWADVKDWERAFSAARLAVLMAAATEEGPRPLARHMLDSLQSAAAPAETLRQIRSALLWGDDPQGTEEPQSHSPGAKLARRSPVDEELRQASVEVLTGRGERLSARRKVFLSLFAGETAEGLAAAHGLLMAAEGTETDVLRALDVVAAVLAVADGRIQYAYRFSSWLAGGAQQPLAKATGAGDPWMAVLAKRSAELFGGGRDVSDDRSSLAGSSSEDRRALVAKAYERQMDRWLSWATDGLSEGEFEWGATFWLGAISSQTGQEGLSSIVSDIVEEAASIEPADALKAMRTVVDRLESPLSKYYAQTAVARVLYGQRKYSDCLVAFEDADKVLISNKLPPPRDLGIGVARALALMREQRLDEAAQLLARLQQWDGPAESKSTALYLTGLVHAQKGENEKAAAAFRRLVAEHPDSSYKEKAEQHLSRL